MFYPWNRPYLSRDIPPEMTKDKGWRPIFYDKEESKLLYEAAVAHKTAFILIGVDWTTKCFKFNGDIFHVEMILTTGDVWVNKRRPGKNEWDMFAEYRGRIDIENLYS